MIARQRDHSGETARERARTGLHSSRWSKGKTPFSGGVGCRPRPPPKAPPAAMAVLDVLPVMHEDFDALQILQDRSFDVCAP
jgi:hypothetical protein